MTTNLIIYSVVRFSFRVRNNFNLLDVCYRIESTFVAVNDNR